MLYACSEGADAQFEVVSAFDPNAIGVRDFIDEGNGNYAVLEGNRVVISSGKNLFVIKNGAIERSIKSKIDISTFDINKKGNGVLVSGRKFFLIKNFFIEDRPLSVNLPGADGTSFVVKVDMIGDSCFRVMQNYPDTLVYVKTRIIDNNIEYGADQFSFFISKTGSSYVGLYKGSHYFIDFTAKDGVEKIMGYSLKDGRPYMKRTINIGDLGKPIPMSFPIRFNEASGDFFILLLNKNKVEIEKSNLVSWSD